MSDNTDQTLEQLKALPQRAMKQIKALCRGNLAPKGSVKVKSAGGEIITCDAITHLELHTEIAEEQKKGRVQVGEVLQGPEQVQLAVKELVNKASKNDETRKFLANLLLERPDKGFSLHAEYFDVPQLNRDFSSFEPCATCHGIGNTACGKCGGERREVCNICHGRTMIPCKYCSGSGFMQGPDGKQRQCNRCFGQRQIGCSICQKTGRIACRQCKGSGTNTCGTCKGAAFYTRIVHIIVKLKTLFEIDRAALPHPVVKIFEDAGDVMAQKGHIKLSAAQVKREDGGLAIQYKAVFPYGDLIFSINGKNYKTHLFGYKGKMLKLPNFLNDLIEKDFELLQQAANKQGNVAGKIQKSSQSRLIAEGLRFAVSLPAKKAMIALKKKFPFGISNDSLKDIIITTNKALANVTAGARYGGLGVSLGVMTALAGIYYMGGVRDATIAAIGLKFIMAVDIAVVIVGGWVGNIAVSYMAKRPLQKALGSLMPDKKRGRFKTKRMIPAWVLYTLSLLVCIGVILFAKSLGIEVPSGMPS